MATTDLELLESYHSAILLKYKSSGLSSLTPSEICLTLLSPSWEFHFLKEEKSSWLLELSSYIPTLLEHLKQSSSEHLQYKAQESLLIRQQAGKKFIECLDSITRSKQGSISDPNLKDDVILERLKETLAKKNSTLINLLLKNDSNHDGMMNKSEFINVLESLALAPQEIIALIRIAGFRTGVDLIPISGFADFLSRRGEDRKKEEYALFTKLLSVLTEAGRSLEKAFALLDSNKDGVITIDEFRAELAKLNAGFSFSECKEVFTVIDKDRSGSISLEELKGKLSVLLPAGSKKESRKPGGLVTVNVLKGQKFKAASRLVKVKLGEVEFSSQSLAEANPEFKFKTLFEVNEASAKEIEFEVVSGKKVEGRAVILTSEIVRAAELKKKLDILGANKALVGTLFIKANYSEQEEVSSKSDRGSLMVTLVRGDTAGLDLKMQVFDRIYSVTSANLAKTITVAGVSKPKSEKFVLGSDLDKPEYSKDLLDMVQAGSRTPLEFRFGNKKIFVQVVWEDFDEQDELEHSAAARIQKMWRIYSILHSARLKSRRILIVKKVVTYAQRRYLLLVYKLGREIEVEVHPGDAAIGIDTVLSVNRFPYQDLSDLLTSVSLKPDFRLSPIFERRSLKGHLSIQISQVRSAQDSLIVFNLEKASLAVNPREKAQVDFFNLNFSQIPGEVSVSLVSAHSKAVLGSSQLFWQHSINSTEEWTSNVLVCFDNNSSFIARASWDKLDDLTKEEEAAVLIQKHWRAKKEREEMKIRLRKNTLIARKALVKEGKIYMVSVRERDDQWVAEFNLADNPQVPSYEVEKVVQCKKGDNLDELFEKLA